MQKNRIKLVIFVIILVGVYYAYRHFQLDQYLNLDYLQAKKEILLEFLQKHFWQAVSAYAAIYIVVVTFAIPGAAVMTLAGGMLFGFWQGTLIVSFASSIGATLSFLVSRYFLRGMLQSKFPSAYKRINRGIKEDGAFYLFTLRMVPAFPFFLINLVMGLTEIPVFTFYVVSQIGMLAGTAVYVYAGTALSELHSLSGIFSKDIILAFTLLGIFPLIARWVTNWIKGRKYLSRYKKPKSFDYNLVVLGGGSAGLISALIAATVRSKVALVEKHKMGGDCLNTGCVPSKAIISSAKLAHSGALAKDLGLSSVKVSFRFSDVMKRVQSVIRKIEPHDSVERYESMGVECFQGEAKVKSPYEVEVNGKTLSTKSIILATGARPLVPKIPGIENADILTSDTIWDLKSLPKNLVVLGGGPIGCELAQALSRLGAKVTIIEMADRILLKEEKEVSERMNTILESEGIKLLTSHKAVRFERSGKKKSIVCESPSGGRKIISYDKVLLALGRKANVEGFGLEELDVKLTETGTIQTDAFLRTNYPNILACGDVVGPYQFTHMASHQAWFASVNALFQPLKKFKVDYSVVPWVTYTDPEVARVGLSEEEANSQSIPYETTFYDLGEMDRALTESQNNGFVKVLTSKGSDRVLGATIVSSRAGEMIVEFILAMKYKIGLNKILGTIHPYPTFSEANKFAAGNWKKARKPEGLLGWVEKFHSWRRS